MNRVVALTVPGSVAPRPLSGHATRGVRRLGAGQSRDHHLRAFGAVTIGLVPGDCRARSIRSTLSSHASPARLISRATHRRRRVRDRSACACVAPLSRSPVGRAPPDADPVDVMLLDARRDLDLGGVVIHWPTDRTRLVPQRRSNIRCTNVLRTIIDLGAVDPGGLHSAVGHAIATDLASLEAIDTMVAERHRQGRRGVVALREAIADWSIDDKPADSVLELVMTRLIARYGLPPVVFHPTIEGCEVDFQVCDTPVILECDGWRHHGLDRTGFERDRDHDADLIAAGWIVVRFSYRAVVVAPAATARRIRAAVQRSAPTLL